MMSRVNILWDLAPLINFIFLRNMISILASSPALTLGGELFHDEREFLF